MLISVPELQALGVNPNRVLHIGAHHGEESQAYADAGWSVVWVEAQEHLARYLVDAGHNVINAAVWSEAKALPFYETSNGQSSSMLPLGAHLEHYPDITVTRTYVVDTTTIDALNVDADFINLDIQGAELEALKGATRTLTNVRWIYTEISTAELYIGQVLEPELNEWLHARGFEQVLRKVTPYSWGDALYLRKSYGNR